MGAEVIGISMGAYGARPYAFVLDAAPHRAMGTPTETRRNFAPQGALGSKVFLENRAERREDTPESFAGDDARHDDDDLGSIEPKPVFVSGVFFWGDLVKRFPRRWLSPEFLEAVDQTTMPRRLQAQLIGYGENTANLSHDLHRADGVPQTPSNQLRMAKLAQLIGFPEERVWR